MERIPLAIYGRADEMFWEALEHALGRVPDISVTRLGAEVPLEQSLVQECPVVLIMESAATDPSTQCHHLFDLYHGLSIIIIDARGLDTIMRLRDIGFDVLLRLIRSVAADLPADQNEKWPRLRVVKPSDIRRLASETQDGANNESGYKSTREHLEDVLGWLDLCLHQRLLKESTTGETVSVPGWAMSPGRARALVDSEYADADEKTLSKTREHLEAKMRAREAASRLQRHPPKLVRLADAFDLTELERQLVTFVLAPEMDGRYARVFGFLNDDLTRRRPTPSLLRQLLLSDDQLVWDVRQMLAGEGSLAKYRLITVDRNDPTPASEVGLVIAPEVVAYLLAEPQCSPDYGTHLELLKASEQDNNDNGDSATRLLQERLAFWRATTRSSDAYPVMQVIGDEATLGWFKRVARAAGDTVVVFDVAALSDLRIEQLTDGAIGAARVAVLHDAVLLVTGLAALQRTERERLEALLISELRLRIRRLAVYGYLPWLLPSGDAVWQVERAIPTIDDRVAMWRERAQAFGTALSESDARALAATIRFDEPEIDSTLRISCGEPGNSNSLSVIQAAARRVARRVIPSTVRRSDATFTWDDIVLPESVLTQLRSIPSHVRHSGEVLEEWDYRSRMPYGHGITALFSGVSGTGKTMAAQILAGDLGVELFQVDLAKTVSKYIGETEKNLDAVFDAAEKASAVLLFDEADALFGKRTEVRDAHDRYANVEVAYLLQRMEAYAGLAVLTTNFRQNLDTAFMRRLRFVIEFPAPNASEREAIWQRVFPSSAPLAKDVSFTFVARRLELTGGNIQQIALRAAFAAVAEGESIAMRHIVGATRDELHKLGMNNAEQRLADFGGLSKGCA